MFQFFIDLKFNVFININSYVFRKSAISIIILKILVNSILKITKKFIIINMHIKEFFKNINYR